MHVTGGIPRSISTALRRSGAAKRWCCCLPATDAARRAIGMGAACAQVSAPSRGSRRISSHPAPPRDAAGGFSKSGPTARVEGSSGPSWVFSSRAQSAFVVVEPTASDGLLLPAPCTPFEDDDVSDLL